jgi:hypothetical protein
MALLPATLQEAVVGNRHKLTTQITLGVVVFIFGAFAPLALAGKGSGRSTGTGTTSSTSGGTTNVTTTTSTTTPLPANPAAARLLGVTLTWSSTWLSTLDTYASTVGRRPSVVQTYRDMSTNLLNLSDMNGITSRGGTPLVTLEPMLWTNPSDPSYALRNIASGNFDGWFAAAADQAAAYRKPFYLRFAPEMNGAWEPWGPGVNGNTAQDFVNAWRHVWGIFAAHGATNVKWVWSPNVKGGAVDFVPYYPGSAEVDVLGLDGYNWGSLDVWQTWTQIFGASYDELCTLDATKPVMIAETASTEFGGDKAAWITSAFTKEIPTRTPRVKIVVWFDENKETDWRVESSTASLNAYHAIATATGWG